MERPNKVYIGDLNIDDLEDLHKYIDFLEREVEILKDDGKSDATVINMYRKENEKMRKTIRTATLIARDLAEETP